MNDTKRSVLGTESGPDLSRHERVCSICHHPEREAIDEAFLMWRSVYSIRCEFHIESPSAIYRHAHAVGLFAQRGRRLRYALEHIIEHADHTKPTSDSILRAIRSYSLLDDEGKWHEPPSQVVFSTSTAAALAQSGDSNPLLSSATARLLEGASLAAGSILVEEAVPTEDSEEKLKN